MGSTPKYHLPYPEPTDPPNGPAQMQALAAAVESALGGAIPVGGIIMWSGTLATIPSGWALCNGANGTPDLRGRFIVGASVDSGATNSGASYNKGATGGADSVVLNSTHLPSHTHTEAAAGTHDHTTYWRQIYNTVSGTSAGLALSNSAGVAATSLGVDSSGSHTHAITATPAPTAGVPLRPLFFALAYIMKLVA